MVKINNISLINFRNFENKEILFDKKINIFFGDNGSGKTNILESISLLSKGRGIRNSNLSNLIKQNKENFFIKTSLEINNDSYNVEVYSKKIDNKIKKITNVNDDHSRESLNFLNSSLSNLIFLPEMERLFHSSPTYRRNFIDRLIFSENNEYNKIINKYKKNLLERTKILQQNQIDSNWINRIEIELSQIGLQIYKLRNSKINSLNSLISNLNKTNNYPFDINLNLKDEFYEPDLTPEKYNSLLYNSRDYDKKFGGSKIGPHKSDFFVNINNEYDASQLSTCQQKTVVLMVILAQCHNLVNLKEIKPVLLFDEICSHLDTHNRKILLDMINSFDIQFFLTGTEKTLFSFISTNVEFYNITEI